VGELPAPRPRKALPQRAVTVLLLMREGEILLEQRPPTGVWGGLWSLPEVATDIDVETHVSVHLRARAAPLRRWPVLHHGFTHFALAIHPVSVPILQWPLDACMPGARWFGRTAAIAAAVPAPIRKLLRGIDAGEFELAG